MKMFSAKIMAALFISMFILSCGKDKPTEPPPSAHAVSLQYRNYFPVGNSYCLRLVVGVQPLNRCGLGIQSISVWDGDYECKLYIVNDSGALTLLASSPLHLDRNFTCIVDGANIYWQYWD